MVDLTSNPDIITPETKDSLFSDLQLNPFLVKAYNSLNFYHPTPIQFHSIPKGLQGKSLIAQAKAGTGKTLAFSSIILEKLLKNPDNFETMDKSLCKNLENTKKKQVRALILVPTRELAIQIHKFLSVIFDKTL